MIAVEGRIEGYKEISFIEAMDNIKEGKHVYVRNPHTNEIERFYYEDMFIKYQITCLRDLLKRQYYVRYISRTISFL